MSHLDASALAEQYTKECARYGDLLIRKERLEFEIDHVRGKLNDILNAMSAAVPKKREAAHE
jgi:hypothetical protein